MKNKKYISTIHVQLPINQSINPLKHKQPIHCPCQLVTSASAGELRGHSTQLGCLLALSLLRCFKPQTATAKVQHSIQHNNESTSINTTNAPQCCHFASQSSHWLLTRHNPGPTSRRSLTRSVRRLAAKSLAQPVVPRRHSKVQGSQPTTRL